MGHLEAANLAQLFHLRIEESRNKVALRRKKRGQWIAHTWEHVETKVSQIAHSLMRHGLSKGQTIAIISNTRLEWTLVDWAALSLGLVVVPVYPSNSPDDLDKILSDSKPKAIFFEDRIQANKIASILHRLNFVELYISFEQTKESSLKSFELDEWIHQALPDSDGMRLWRSDWKNIANTITPGDIVSIVYTSGTTGKPRGVELSHYNFVCNLKDCVKVGIARENDSTLLFLPLAHILGRVEQMLALSVGWRINYAQNFSTLFEDLQEANPSVLFAVPRVFEQMYAKVKKSVLDENLVSRVVMQSFFSSLARYSQSFESGSVGTFSKLSHGLLERILFFKIRMKFGTQIRHCICGGAPLSPDVARFFHLAGVSILEGYGLTETTGPITVNRPNEFRFGSVGKVFPSAQIKIANDGEILVKGPSVLLRYHGQDVLSGEDFEDGYYKTGDIGYFDHDDFLYIQDRKKDIIISSGGKNVSPQKVEAALQSDILIRHAIIAGDQKPYLVALLSLNSLESTEEARKHGFVFQSLEDLYASSRFKRLLASRIEKINQKLAGFENIRRFAILGRELSLEAGEMTPSFKVRRKFCLKKFSKMIEELYRD